MLRRCLSYNDVLLVPRYSPNEHLTDANIDMEYTNIPSAFTSPPIINSPMDKVCSKELLENLYNVHKFPITIHRYFKTVQDQLAFVESLNLNEKKSGKIFLAVGSVYKWKEWIDTVLATGYSISVDMAQGDSKTCIETVEYINKNNKYNVNIMAGDVATKSGFMRLVNAGANFIRVGIGGGCVTPDTEVWTFNKGKVKIIDVKIGDKVYTHKNRWKTVTGFNRTFVDDDLIIINEKITLSKHHEIYANRKDIARKEFIAAEDIKLGDSIWCYIEGRLFNTKVTNIQLNTSYRDSLYDIEVEEDHSFVANGVIVHNSICSTRTTTGFGVPTLESIFDCKSIKPNNVYLIADGGISNTGDIVKAIHAGADMVMLGKMFAATSLSPGMKYNRQLEITDDEDEMKWVEYRGMASHNAQQTLDNSKIHSIEGVSGLVAYSGTTDFVVNSMLQRLRSAIAYYGGCKNWDELRRFTKMIEITDGGREESGNGSIYIPA
jgi:IMP dehydrogenase/GMP reductase